MCPKLTFPAESEKNLVAIHLSATLNVEVFLFKSKFLFKSCTQVLKFQPPAATY